MCDITSFKLLTKMIVEMIAEKIGKSTEQEIWLIAKKRLFFKGIIDIINLNQ